MDARFRPSLLNRELSLGWSGNTRRRPTAGPSSRQAQCGSSGWFGSAFADLDNWAVEHDVTGPLAQAASLLELVDLIVAGDQHRLRAGFPGQEGLRPQRRVGQLARLGAEHGQLAGGGAADDEVDLRQVLDRADAGRVVDVHRGGVGLRGYVGVDVSVFVTVVVALKRLLRDGACWAHYRPATGRVRGHGERHYGKRRDTHNKKLLRHGKPPSGREPASGVTAKRAVRIARA